MTPTHTNFTRNIVLFKMTFWKNIFKIHFDRGWLICGSTPGYTNRVCNLCHILRHLVTVTFWKKISLIHLL